MFDVFHWCKERKIEIVRVVDISSLSQKENRDYPYAVLLANTLSKDCLRSILEQGTDKGEW